MKGSYNFKVKSKRVVFEFSIRRNITVIKGDSATGKTTLLHMLYEYLRAGRESGYTVFTNADYFVYLRREVGREWKDALTVLKNTVIFIEENNQFVFSEEFAEFVKTSGNYFVLVSRSPLKMLPYSIHEVYEIVSDRKHADIKEAYHQFKELYSNYPFVKNIKMDIVVTEDRCSGYQFFSTLFYKRNVVSAEGNGGIINAVQQACTGDVLAVVDGAAFGAMVEQCIEYFEAQESRRIALWMPESFEYLILVSGIIHSEELEEILGAVSDHVDSSEYESWERYFTQLLVSLTEHTPYKYSKKDLNEYYTKRINLIKIIEKFPEAIKKNCDFK
ncbi:MAG: translation initiation factor 2 [Eubacterium sp.]|nr:translation initiation factor 2 [Eubacterium sp.]